MLYMRLKIVIKFLFMEEIDLLLKLLIGQYKMQTADCRLQTADRVQNAD